MYMPPFLLIFLLDSSTYLNWRQDTHRWGAEPERFVELDEQYRWRRTAFGGSPVATLSHFLTDAVDGETEWGGDVRTLTGLMRRLARVSSLVRGENLWVYRSSPAFVDRILELDRDLWQSFAHVTESVEPDDGSPLLTMAENHCDWELTDHDEGCLRCHLEQRDCWSFKDRPQDGTLGPACRGCILDGASCSFLEG